MALLEELKKNEAEYKKLKPTRDAKLNARQPGHLPSQTVNPRADVNAIELRSGKTLPEGRKQVEKEKETVKEGAVNPPSKETVLQKLQKGKETEVQILPSPPLKTQRLPYPQRAQKQLTDKGRQVFL